jgi:hypothetical protein
VKEQRRKRDLICGFVNCEEKKIVENCDRVSECVFASCVKEPEKRYVFAKKRKTEGEEEKAQRSCAR